MVRRARVLNSDVSFGKVEPLNASQGVSKSLYDGAWVKARATVLKREPLCLPSKMLRGETVLADTLDHLYPHKRLSWLFWLRCYWVPCCATWHNSDKQAIDRAGEYALDALALALGKPTLATLEPERVKQWRQRLHAPANAGRWQ